MERIITAFSIATPPSIPKVPINSVTLGGIFNAVLVLAGAFAVLFIVLGGIFYIMSQGDAAKIKRAKDTILYAGVGLVVVAIAFMVVQIVVGIF